MRAKNRRDWALLAKEALGAVGLRPGRGAGRHLLDLLDVDILGGLSYLKLSAKAGYLPALEFLGNLYAYNEKVKKDLVAAHTFFYLAALIDNKVDIGYHLIIEDEFGISEANINKSKELAEACMAVGLENCELLK